MKSKFIDHVIVGTITLAALLCLTGGNKGVAILVGAIWGAANLFILKHLIPKLLTPGKKDVAKIVSLASLKCPLLYAAGYALLRVPKLPASYLLLGFSLIFVMMVLIGMKSLYEWKHPRNS